MCRFPNYHSTIAPGVLLIKTTIAPVRSQMPRHWPHHSLHATILKAGDLPTKRSEIISTRGKSPVEVFAINGDPNSAKSRNGGLHR